MMATPEAPETADYTAAHCFVDGVVISQLVGGHGNSNSSSGHINLVLVVPFFAFANLQFALSEKCRAL